jgi:transcription initiation factor TFIIIB Brf1 subunit/transcription initiation factor TFIIB
VSHFESHMVVMNALVSVLPHSIVETANAILQQLKYRSEHRFVMRGSIAVACAYIACRIHDVPRSIDELCRCMRCGSKSTIRILRHIERTCPEISFTVNCDDSVRLSSMVPRMVQDLEINDSSVEKAITQDAMRIIRSLVFDDIPYKASTVVGAAIKIAIERKMDAPDINKVMAKCGIDASSTTMKKAEMYIVAQSLKESRSLQ